MRTNKALNKKDELPILYSFRRCPYAMRARLAILSSKIPVIIREVSLKNKPEDLLVLNVSKEQDISRILNFLKISKDKNFPFPKISPAI